MGGNVLPASTLRADSMTIARDIDPIMESTWTRPVRLVWR